MSQMAHFLINNMDDTLIKSLIMGTVRQLATKNAKLKLFIRFWNYKMYINYTKCINFI